MTLATWLAFVAPGGAAPSALLAARLSGAVARPAVRRPVDRLGGSLIGSGAATAAMRRG